MSVLDVAIVGAGAAGVAAGRALAGSGLKVQLLEARDRVGGRAWTSMVEGWPLDLGCGWLHSGDRNPWTAIAEAMGRTVDRTPPPWGRQSGGRGVSPAEQRDAWRAYGSFDQQLHDHPPASDRASDALIAGDPWNDHLEALSGYINGAELEQLSVRDFLAYDDADTGVNWRATDGYGALITAASAGLPVSLGVAVRAVDLGRDLVRLTTSAGQVEARACILTISTEVLGRGLNLPRSLAHKVEAARRLPLGLADKLIFAVDGPEMFEPDSQVIGDIRSAHTGAYHLRPFARPLVEGFFGGACARALEAEGAEGAADFAIGELSNLFGADIRRRLRLIARSAWANDPLALGSYSHALPGYTDARDTLAEPVENRLFFAGEACSRSDFSTAHGAFETGRRAALEVIGALGGTTPSSTQFA